MKSLTTLFKNELKLNIRNMNMVIFAVIMPLVILVILGLPSTNVWLPIVLMVSVTVICTGIAVKFFKWE